MPATQAMSISAARNERSIQLVVGVIAMMSISSPGAATG